MKNQTIYIIIILQLFAFQVTYAQLKPIITLTEEDGLAGNDVKDVIRDKNGILWIGTESGLSRFDGSHFGNIYKSDGLPSNRVWALAEGVDNTIYTGCFRSGLAIIQNDSVIKTLNTIGKYPNTFRKIHYSKQYKRLIVGTNYGLYLLEDTVLLPVKYDRDTSRKAAIISITEYKSRIFFTSLTPAFRNGGTFELFIDSIKPEKSFGKKIEFRARFASTALQDTLYSTDYHKIYKNSLSDIDRKYPVSEIDSSFFIWSMLPFNNKEILCGGYNDGRFKGNIALFDVKQNKQKPVPFKLSAKTVVNIKHDNISNLIWLCTDKGLTGLYSTPFEYYKFENINNILDIGFAGDSLIILAEDYVYYFNNDGLEPLLSKHQIDVKIKKEYDWALKRDKDESLGLFDATSGIVLSSLIKDEYGLYINASRGTINVQDINNYYPFGAGIFKKTGINSAYIAILYYPLRYYPSIINYKGHTEYEQIKSVFEIIESNRIHYFPTNYFGIYAINKNKVYHLDELNSAFDNNITDIDKDEKGNVWCSSNNGNLFQVELGDSFSVLKSLNSSNSGLIGNTIKWIIFNSKYLYVGTNKGLNVISIENLYSKNPKFEYFFNEHNGYGFISAVSPIKDKEGNIYVHTTDKLIKISADFSIKSLLDIKIRDLQINDQESVVENINGKKLPYSINEISFTFFAIKYPTARNLKYRYKVNSGEWNTGNKVNLQSLRAGNYKLVIEVHDKETNKNYSKHIQFHINKPFYQTWWFILIVSIALISIVYLIMMSRIKTLKRFHIEKVKLITKNSELNLRSLQIQMNPHFIFNALNSIQALIIIKNTKNALLYLSNLAGIIRINLENASKEYIHLGKEIEFLKEYTEIEKIRFKQKLAVNFNNKVKDNNVMIPPMLVQPIIENSVKHGIRNLKGNGIVNIDFQIENNSLVVTVEDNGVGRAYTTKNKLRNHNSVGTDIILQRLELLNQKYHTEVHKIETIDLYDDENPIGTKVIIKLLTKRSD